MRVKRIGTVRTYREYETALGHELVPKYLAKSGCSDTAVDIMSDLRTGCNNPMFFGCVVLDGEKAVGFVIAYIAMTNRGKKVIFDHAHVPNMNMAAKVYDLVMDKLGVADAMWVTYRNPEAWVRFCNKNRHPVEVFGWMIRKTKEV